MIKKNEIYNEDCLIGMKKIEDKTVDLICTDLPYGQTARNKWDVVIPFNLLLSVGDTNFSPPATDA
jgi:site-specific DNA-methyltransferase (adenine-specific)